MQNLFKKCTYNVEISGELHAIFPEKYIKDVINYASKKSRVGIFLGSFISKRSDHFYGGKVFLNEGSVNYILKEIKYFKENKKWRM